MKLSFELNLPKTTSRSNDATTYTEACMFCLMLGTWVATVRRPKDLIADQL